MASSTIAVGSISQVAGVRAIAARPAQRCSAPAAFSGLKAVSGVFVKKQASLYTATPCSKGTIVAAASEADLAKVRKIIAGQLAKDEAKITPATTFKELDADSLDTVEIMMALEEEFGVELDEESAGTIQTVQEAADLIASVAAKA
ncbi:acyl carrier protein [Klebsormidium nitens]|uniref:Acyl carrier protein n=1 Tax=Klebsormidium nitens TaxID=105231 RepID=A0A1Y1ITL3_KLENI|nr:acyl carrier protein [Klebsormidium nitens]|eukprot:GAQ91538.1 acyl carrier protein [Klebsormidium nitens]